MCHTQKFAEKRATSIYALQTIKLDKSFVIIRSTDYTTTKQNAIRLNNEAQFSQLFSSSDAMFKNKNMYLAC